MAQLLQTFASAEAEKSDSLFGALGIDLRLLVLQLVAFGILVWLLNKYVYPKLVEAIDTRENAIAESVAAAQKAEAKAESAEQEIEALLKQAKKDAAGIVDAAHKESVAMVQEAEAKAKGRAEQIVKEAHNQLEQDIVAARAQLKAETADLVALATGKIIKEKVDAKQDKVLITNALKEAKA
jgi:F-type H+-transporting ATPase subunit b